MPGTRHVVVSDEDHQKLKVRKGEGSMGDVIHYMLLKIDSTIEIELFDHLIGVYHFFTSRFPVTVKDRPIVKKVISQFHMALLKGAEDPKAFHDIEKTLSEIVDKYATLQTSLSKEEEEIVSTSVNGDLEKKKEKEIELNNINNDLENENKKELKRQDSHGHKKDEWRGSVDE